MTRVDRILVPVDFSPCSEAALSYAAALAERFFSEIDVLHVVATPSPCELEQMRELLERFEERGVLLQGRVLRSDDPAKTILEVAQSGGYELISIGARGHDHLELRHVGRIAESVLARAVCPVVIIRGPEPWLRIVPALRGG